MKENNEKSYKAVEVKKDSAWPEEPKQATSNLIAKRGFSQSRGESTWSVEAGQDVSSLEEAKLEILKQHGVI